MICNTANLLLSLANMCAPFVSHLVFFFCTKRKIQKHSLKVVFEKSYFLKISQYSQGTHVSESLFNKVAGLLYQKETPTQVFSCEHCETFNYTYYEEHLLQTTASGDLQYH